MEPIIKIVVEDSGFNSVEALLQATDNGTESKTLRDLGLPHFFCWKLLEQILRWQEDRDHALAMHIQEEEYEQATREANDADLAIALQQEIDAQDNGVHTEPENVAGESPRPPPLAPDLLAPLRSAVLSESFVSALVSLGHFRHLRVEQSVFSEPGKPLFEKFIARVGVASPDALVCVAFHGTAERNISPILREGLNPRLRGTNGQAHGPGEYFAKDPQMSLSFCSSASGDQHLGQMLVFLLLLEPEEQRKWCSNVVVIQRSDHQLPLGVLHFKRPSHIDALGFPIPAPVPGPPGSWQWRSAARRAEKERRAVQAEVEAKEARKCSRVIQMFLKEDYTDAAALYNECCTAQEPAGPARRTASRIPPGLGRDGVEFPCAIKVRDLLAFQAGPQDAPTPLTDAPMPLQPVPPAWASDLTRWMMDASGCPILDPEVMDLFFPGVRGAFGKPRVFQAPVEELERRAKELRMAVDSDATLLPKDERVSASPAFSPGVSPQTRRSRSRSPRDRASQSSQQHHSLTHSLEDEIDSLISASERTSHSEELAARPLMSGEARVGTWAALNIASRDVIDLD
jgi:hypothetical protein